jgi:hypothetical protein
MIGPVARDQEEMTADAIRGVCRLVGLIEDADVITNWRT